MYIFVAVTVSKCYVEADSPDDALDEVARLDKTDSLNPMHAWYGEGVIDEAVAGVPMGPMQTLRVFMREDLHFGGWE